MTRAGGFNPSLDPFGTGRGGLGRYNISGETISSLAQAEAYAVAVAWGNGAASDAEYLASLQKLVDLESPGTSGYVTAKNKIDDATYTIGRNKVVGKVNAATTPSERVAALKALQTYDSTRLGQMSATDSQAYRDQTERVSSTRVDIRQAQYAELVEKVNRGKGTTDQLIALATRLRHEAGADPDSDDWTKALDELHDRKADEELTDAYQAYQHDRMPGSKLLAKLDARLAQMTEGSPEWRQLHNQREDLVANIKGHDSALADAKMQGSRASGKTTDKAYLQYLKHSYEAETPGTAEAVQAGNRLRDFTFSLAEDKLRFDVGHGKRPVADLVRFYTAYQHGMNPGSERWRQLQNAIESLKGGRGGGGGGGGGRGGRGGGGRSSGGGINLGPKILGGPAVMSDFLGGAGGVKAPPGFDKLFKVDITNVASKHWWDNNLRSMTDSFQDGRGTWTYYDQRGRAYELPFTPQLMNEMDALNVGYVRRGLAAADSAKEAQTWVGRLVSATKQGQAHGATYTMDVYGHAFADLDKAKQKALAGGRYGEYANLMRQQTDLARLVLGIPEGAKLEIGNASNPYLTLDQKQRIENDLARLAPKNVDQESPFYNPTGDPVIGLIRDGAISTRVDPISGDIVESSLDPNRGYVTQEPDGSISLVEVPDPGVDPSAWQFNELTGGQDPRYLTDHLHAKVRVDGQDIDVWQPISDPDSEKGVAAGVSVWMIDAVGAMRDRSQPAPGSRAGGTPASYRQLQNTANGRAASLPMLTTYTRESVTVFDPVTGLGHQTSQVVAWISTDGETWFRKPNAAGVQPRLVINEDSKSNVTLGDDGKWKINGKDASLSEILKHTHIWSGSDAVRAGAESDKMFGIGAPGAHLDVRYRTGAGTLDLRPGYILRTEEEQATRLRMDAGEIAMHARPQTGPSGVPGEAGGMVSGGPYGTTSFAGSDRRRGDEEMRDSRAGRSVDPMTAFASLAGHGDLLPTFLRQADARRRQNDVTGIKPMPKALNVPPKSALLADYKTGPAPVLKPVLGRLATQLLKPVKALPPLPKPKPTAKDSAKRHTTPTPPPKPATAAERKDTLPTPPPRPPTTPGPVRRV